jgi:hypothetical protein
MIPVRVTAAQQQSQSEKYRNTDCEKCAQISVDMMEAADMMAARLIPSAGPKRLIVEITEITRLSVAGWRDTYPRDCSLNTNARITD